MSTLKTHNLQSPDAGSVNIALTANAGMIVTGISTFNDQIDIGSLGVTTNFTVAGISTFSGDVFIPDKIIHSGDTNTSIRFPSADTIRLETGGATRLTLDSNGNTLVSGGLYAQGDSYISDSIIHDGDTNTKIRFPAADTITAETGGSERLRIAPNGSVSINYAGTGDNTLHIGNTSSAGGIIIKSPGNHYANMVIDSNRSGANNGIFNLAGRWNGNDVAYISFTTGTDTTNKDDGYIRMYTRESGQALTERLQITTNGHLLLGTSTDYADVNSDDVQIYGTSDTGMSITSGTSHYGSIYFGDGTSGDSRNRGILRYYHGDNSMALWTNASERLRINSNGDMGLGLTASYSGIFGGSQRTFQIGGTAAPCLRITSSTSNQADLVIHAGNSGRRADIANITENGSISMWTKPTGGSNTERIKISPDGVVNMPYQPVFSATTSATSSAGFIVFNQTSCNVGGHYSTSNGRFTAPVAGNYYFSFYGMSPHNNTSNQRCAIYVNGNYWSAGQYIGGVGYTGYTNGGYTHLTLSTALPLSANDYVQISWQYADLHSGHCKFTGFLVG